MQDFHEHILPASPTTTEDLIPPYYSWLWIATNQLISQNLGRTWAGSGPLVLPHSQCSRPAWSVWGRFILWAALDFELPFFGPCPSLFLMVPCSQGTKSGSCSSREWVEEVALGRGKSLLAAEISHEIQVNVTNCTVCATGKCKPATLPNPQFHTHILKKQQKINISQDWEKSGGKSTLHNWIAINWIESYWK